MERDKSLALFHIQHRTQYDYNQPVSLGPHRLMLRPRESRELRLVSINIHTAPSTVINWASDVFGNAVATADFQSMSRSLVVESDVVLELNAPAWPVFPIAAAAGFYPFAYAPEERADLGALLITQHADPMGRLLGWARSFIAATPTDTLSLLKDLNAGVSASICYQAREDEGTQSPTYTLDCGRGSCRDMALLFAEGARALGFGARIVSGYSYNPANKVGSSTTHAWAEVFVPGAGWISFDPTNRQMGGFNLIPVAVARDLAQTMPVSGSYMGSKTDLKHLRVAVQVTQRQT